MLWKDMIPLVKHIDANGKQTDINIIAGVLDNLRAPAPTPDSWASDPQNNVAIWTLRLESEAKFTIPKSYGDVNRTLYFYRGSQIEISRTEISEYHLIEMNPSEDVTLTAGKEDAYILLLQGKAINEPVAQHGPFVMNTQQVALAYARTIA